MKKLLISVIFMGAIACQNPEDKATTIKDTMPGYNENNTQNTPPGGTSADTSGMRPTDSSARDSLKK